MTTRFRFVSALAFLFALGVLQTTPAMAQTKPAAAAAEKFGMTEARAAVMALPEVKVWEEQRRAEAAKAEGGQPPGGILTSQRPLKGVKHWAVTLYNNPQVEAKKWAVFLVRAKDGKIFVEAESGKVITLEDWRKTRPAV